MRFKASATSAPIDLPAFRAAFDRLATRWRDLKIDADGVQRNQSVSRGVHVESGTHPWPGVRYRVENSDATGPHPWLVDLKSDDATTIEFHVRDVKETQTGDVKVTRPVEVDAVELNWIVRDVGAGWATRGPVLVEVTGDFTRSRLEVAVRHRLVRAYCTVGVDASDRGQWRTSLDATIRGHGVLRPVVATTGPLIRPWISRQLRKAAREFPTKVDEFNRQVATRFGTPPSPDRIAEVLLDDFLNESAS